MPIYRLRYRVECDLSGPEKFEVTAMGHTITFAFLKKEPLKPVLVAEVEMVGDHARQVESLASHTVLPTVLDALSFSTGKPFLLQECGLILKREPGAENRRALYVNVSHSPTPSILSTQQLEEAQRILGQAGEPDMALCWHRYAAHRGYSFDKFLFQWLAFEVLAGPAEVSIACPNCGHVRSHAGTDKRRAYDLFSRTNADVSQEAFNKDIWGKARNAVFHGQKYPGPKFLAALNEISKKLRDACNASIEGRFHLPHRVRALHTTETWLLYLFIEWETAKPEADYPADFPEEGVLQLEGPHLAHQFHSSAPNTAPFRLLDISKEYGGW